MPVFKIVKSSNLNRKGNKRIFNKIKDLSSKDIWKKINKKKNENKKGDSDE